jgi:ABC-type transporter MlaC component
MLDKNPQDVNALIDFFRFQRQNYFRSEDITEENLGKFFEAATNPDIIDFCKRFQAYG